MGWDRIWDEDGSRCADARLARARPRAPRSQPAYAALSARAHRAHTRAPGMGWIWVGREGAGLGGWNGVEWMGWDGMRSSSLNGSFTPEAAADVIEAFTGNVAM